MKAEELRIGNWIGLNLKEFPDNYFKVSEVGETMKLETEYYDIQDCDPIPLTPELLVKCGFVKSDDKYGGWLSSKTIKVQPYTQYQLRVSEDEKGFYYADDTFDIRITSLHQLQNLYFALTQTELQISQ